ncbi:hypothetical protein [uncultured Mediterranean phage]|nr:hypothetical protein [uncultured Mediterranean phage]
MLGPGDTLSTGRATLDQIYQWHSDAVDRAVLWYNQNHGVPIADGYTHAKGICWVLVDNCTFRTLKVEGKRPSTWANGQWILHGGVETIYVPLYKRVVNWCSLMPEDTPPWTVNHDPSNHNRCRWGVLSPGGEFPATRHELGHAIWDDPNFGH